MAARGWPTSPMLVEKGDGEGVREWVRTAMIVGNNRRVGSGMVIVGTEH